MQCVQCGANLEQQDLVSTQTFPGTDAGRCRHCGTINLITQDGPRYVLICDVCAAPFASPTGLGPGEEICPDCRVQKRRAPAFLIPLLDKLSRAREITLGNEAARNILKNKTVIPQGPTVVWLNRVVSLLGSESPRPDLPYSCILVQDPEPNALSIPGGIILVNTGLFDFVEREGEIVFVLAHEVSHICMRHGLLNLEHREKMAPIRFLANLAVLLITGGAAWFLIPFVNVLLDAEKMGYGRQHETEADKMGMRLMLDVGYDPTHAAIFFDRLAALQPSSQYMAFLASHPSPLDRRNAVRSFLHEHPVDPSLLRGNEVVGRTKKIASPTTQRGRSPIPVQKPCGCCSCCGCSGFLLALLSLLLSC
ncbi:MAG TPA: M48 family metallopeptidase [Thermoanaerobaculia bacterium]|nr:M48 family metallopeptidase [Thermoanaerobaculia bacterium]HUM29848.1 M48 family metallopeptidase [Thermoanaerobaculia bacterium]HXK68123.1 M48 family metallopeptidase [Thermoanaerobaculia bacterium]